MTDKYILDLHNGTVEFITFSGGEVHLKRPVILRNTDKILEIFAKIKCSDDLMKLLLLTDSLRRQGYKRIAAYIPYLPYARQDRIANEGDALSIKVFADIVNSQNYEYVKVLDPHSDVSEALINNIRIIKSNVSVISKAMKNHFAYGVLDRIVIAPDAGAMKKLTNLFRGSTIVLCTKSRDTMTGKLSNVKIHTDIDLNDKELLIIDDILDGGGTFELLSTAIRKEYTPKKLELFVTHSIFSKGFKCIENFDNVYTTNSFINIKEVRDITNINILDIINLEVN